MMSLEKKDRTIDELVEYYILSLRSEMIFNLGEIPLSGVYLLLGGGWWVGGVLFFVHTPVQSCPYTRATRGQASLRSE